MVLRFDYKKYKPHFQETQWIASGTNENHIKKQHNRRDNKNIEKMWKAIRIP